VSVARAAIVAEARGYLGTPFEHQGRLRGVGIDCAGLVIGVARGLGLPHQDVDGYARAPLGGALVRELERQMDRVAIAAAAEGDVLVLRIEYDPQHLAIVSGLEPLSVVHAYQGKGVGKCVEHRLDARWLKRIVGAFRYRGIEA
jgi:NlpC/P60 family putative phage cell wall peptidase